MGWLNLSRVPEPEVMDDSDEVEAYASAAAQAYLDRIDDTFVAHAVCLVRGRESGRALDIGSGPGQIVLKLARRLPGWQFVGVDRSSSMIRQARASLAGQGVARLSPPGQGAPEGCVQFFVADGNRLPFPSAQFDLVMCNSVLHHLTEPHRLLAEVARLVKPDGAILIRDLRRPSRFAYPLHVRWYGRHYSGLMYKLYCNSVRSAYTEAELEELRRDSPLANASPAPAAVNRGTRVFRHKRTHLGLERPAL
ncbi:MAG TPA: class I SAM-dependent methyltransferase [Candidatus Acidoferrales bacterium]|nr:class I SAM-dependent methyltransferase [Candidatus Acidoferrales bacterium]